MVDGGGLKTGDGTTLNGKSLNFKANGGFFRK